MKVDVFNSLRDGIFFFTPTLVVKFDIKSVCFAWLCLTIYVSFGVGDNK
jgi:hypothetical protein